MIKKIILIDGNNIAYRAFYALPDTITTSSGITTNAVLGFTNMLLKLMAEEDPDTIVCAFDSKKPTFRHAMFEEYKIHRKPMPLQLSHQLPLIREVMEAFGIPCLQREGVEADDILASIASSSINKYQETLIVTGDKDILQLVSEKIKVMGVKRGVTDTVIYDRDMVKQKYGVNPDKIKELLALMGDSSDNIPGVSGIGPKTAVKLINRFGSLDKIYKDLEETGSEKLKELLNRGRDMAFLSRELATLKDDLEMDLDSIFIENSGNIDISRVRQVFESLEFKNLLKRLPDLKSRVKTPDEIAAIKTSIPAIRQGSITESLDFKAMAKASGRKAYLLITGSIEQPDGLMFYFGGAEAYQIRWKDLDDLNIMAKVKELVEDESISKSGFGFKILYKTLKKKGMSLRGRLYDYRLFYLILNSFKTDVSIDDIASQLLKTDIRAFNGWEDSMDEGKNNKAQVPGSSQLSLDFKRDKTIQQNDYTEDRKKETAVALGSISLYPRMEKELEQKVVAEGLERIYWEIEEPLVRVLAEMELKGVAIDLEYLALLIKDYDQQIKSLTEEIYRLCGECFNINSSQQLSEILYKKLKLPVIKKTKTGLSTDASTLQAIREHSPVVEKILQYREKIKLKNTYIDVLPALANKNDGRVHTTYHQLGTTTGRISSSDPNLQNIPVRTEYGKQIRKAFIPGDGYDLLLTSDYSQIELRVLAHLSGDENLLDAFGREEDIHVRTASEIFGVEYDEINRRQRRMAKTINFGIIYGMTEYGLAARLSISEDEARDYINRYFEKYSGVKRYLRSLIDTAYKKGYSSTMFGRRRYIRELGSSNKRLRNLGERFAVNTPIQGSAADIMKLATVLLYRKLEKGRLDSNIILQVHDELVLEVKAGDQEKVHRIVKDSMENCVKLKVKLEVDIATGRNWYI